MDFKFTSRSDLDTFSLAQNFESEKFPGMLICLSGELGSGKTVFVKGFAQALGIDDTITSPTFSLVKQYNNGEMPLNHMDVYRLEDSNEDFGLDDYLNNDGVTIIEWPEMIKDQLPDERLDLVFKIVDDTTRIIIIKPYGKQYEDLVDAVL